MREEERNKGITKQLENKEQNGDMYVPLNNYLIHKWIKFSKQKSENG